MDSDRKHSYDHDDSSPKGIESPQPTTIGGYVPDTDEEKKLLRKIDLYLLPMIFIMYA